VGVAVGLQGEQPNKLAQPVTLLRGVRVESDPEHRLRFFHGFVLSFQANAMIMP
jgi:hypothetical protein